MVENENTTCLNLLDVTKAMLREKVTTVSAYIHKTRSQINNLTYHPRKRTQ